MKKTSIFGAKTERRFMGMNASGLDEVLDTLCRLEDDIAMTDKEQEAFDIAIQCVTQIINRARDGKGINWD